jgi:ankyrin repeat protein
MGKQYMAIQLLHRCQKGNEVIDSDGYSALQRAVIDNDLEAAKELLTKGADCTYEKPIDLFQAVIRKDPQKGCALAMALACSHKKDMRDMIALLLRYYPRSVLQQKKALLSNDINSNILAMLIRAGAYLEDQQATILLQKSIRENDTPLALAICQQRNATSIELPPETEKTSAAEAIYQYFVTRNRQHIAIIVVATGAAMLLVTYINMHYHLVSLPIFIAAHAALGMELITSCTILSMRLPKITYAPSPSSLQNQNNSVNMYSRIINYLTSCNLLTSSTNTK